MYVDLHDWSARTRWYERKCRGAVQHQRLARQAGGRWSCSVPKQPTGSLELSKKWIFCRHFTHFQHIVSSAHASPHNNKHPRADVHTRMHSTNDRQKETKKTNTCHMKLKPAEQYGTWTDLSMRVHCQICQRALLLKHKSPIVFSLILFFCFWNLVFWLCLHYFVR